MSSIVHKNFTASISPSAAETGNAGSRRLKFVISTDSLDRESDTVDPSRIDLAAFRRNPVILYAHQYKSLPIAKAVSIGIENGRLTSVAEFAPPAMSEFADTVFKLCRAGFLRACSIGFRPIDSPISNQAGGVDYGRVELLEWSICPIPANPDALLDGPAKSAGARRPKGSGFDIDGEFVSESELRSVFEETIDGEPTPAEIAAIAAEVLAERERR